MGNSAETIVAKTAKQFTTKNETKEKPLGDTAPSVRLPSTAVPTGRKPSSFDKQQQLVTYVEKALEPMIHSRQTTSYQAPPYPPSPQPTAPATQKKEKKQIIEIKTA